jgi:RNA methyltransferase, TrmH family
VATPLGVHSERLARVAALRSRKGRRAGDQFAFEGPTLLHEARESSFVIAELYATQTAFDETPLVRELDESGTPTFIVEPASAARISDLTSPSGIVAVAAARLRGVDEIFTNAGPIVVLGDLGDPSNAGTLLRSADAFGCGGVVFGALGVEPYHPKVVRGSMGAVFRLPLAVAEPGEVAAAAARAGVRLLGLTARGEAIAGERWERPTALVVGHERAGLGRWLELCEGLLEIPMRGRAESLSAAVAGSIALYEATRSIFCQESTQRPTSQDYQG